MDVWARSVAAGVAEELYWRLTPLETGALLEALGKREYRRELNATRRAAMVAAEVRNTLRSKPTDRVWAIKDFVMDDEADEVDEASYGSLLPPKELRRHMDVWARTHNRQMRQA